MAGKSANGKWGQVLFWVTFVAVLVFFWWLLIYDHGIVSTH